MQDVLHAGGGPQTAADRVSRMAEDVRRGLTARLPSIPSKYFYDDRGLKLFDQITGLPEYYLTRTEVAILESHADEVAARVAPREFVELGSGTSRKVRILLEALSRTGRLRRCLLLDINERSLQQAVAALTRAFPGLQARGIVGDFEEDLPALGRGGERLTAFLGSTIGNLHPSDVPFFLSRLAATLEPGDGLLLGLDLIKDKARLEAAYNDALGVTDRFNRNVLQVINDTLGADFDLDAFQHRAFYDEANAWIEMRLRATRATSVSIPMARVKRRFEAGEEIRTEISCKFSRESLVERLAGTGLGLEAWYTDPERLFAVALLRRV